MDYRSAALKILPHLCARCGREFEGKRLRELTVHHKDGDHHNNPPDASNWEMLCVYCHENEHAREVDARAGGSVNQPEPESASQRPFAGLDKLIKK